MSVLVPFFENQVFFLTGVTGIILVFKVAGSCIGFLGKVVLHKILTSCPNLGANSIYVLVRGTLRMIDSLVIYLAYVAGKKNMNSEERFNEDVFHKSPLFAHMGALRHKIKVGLSLDERFSHCSFLYLFEY
jgi:hypothetical protein